MLWKKKSKGGEPAEARPEERDAAEPVDRSLDVLTALIKLYGKYAFDTDQANAGDTEAQCNEWATRIALGTTRAQGQAQNDSDAPAPRRDWPGLISFMQDKRRSESDYVVRSQSDFREAILCFADCLSRTLGDEQKSDQVIGKKLDTLSRALETRDTTRICVEAQQVVETVRHSIGVRRARAYFFSLDPQG